MPPVCESAGMPTQAHLIQSWPLNLPRLCTVCANARNLADPNNGLKICAGCQSVCYCSRQCQKEHWSAHRSFCLRDVKHKHKHKHKQLCVVVRLLSGEWELLYAPHVTTIREVKRMVLDWAVKRSGCWDRADFVMELVHNGDKLRRDNATLGEVGVISGDEIQLICRRSYVAVSLLSGGPGGVHFEVSRLEEVNVTHLTRVGAFKAMVHDWAFERSGCVDSGLVFCIELVHNGKMLRRDMATLGEVGVTSGDEIQLIPTAVDETSDDEIPPLVDSD